MNSLLNLFDWNLLFPRIIRCIEYSHEEQENRFKKEYPLYDFMTGKDFKAKYNYLRFVSLSNESCDHDNLKIKKGLVVDDEFNEQGGLKYGYMHYQICLNDADCYEVKNHGKIRFCATNHIQNWLYRSETIGKMRYLWEIEIPDDAVIYGHNDEFIASRLVFVKKYELFNQNTIGQFGVPHGDELLSKKDKTPKELR